MIFGGFSTPTGHLPRPQGSKTVTAGLRTWTLGDGPTRVEASLSGRRHVLVLGWCGASKFETQCLSLCELPDDIAWRWSGTYTVIEETEAAVVVYTDPAAARPVYMTAFRGGWAWCSSARALAGLTNASVDPGRLAGSVFLPSVPLLAGSRTFFTGVEQLPPGCRIELPAAGGSPRCTILWRPSPDPSRSRVSGMRAALTAAVTLRAAADPTLSCDLSGGLDSTTVAVLAANALPPHRRLDAVTLHPEGDLTGADLHYARTAVVAHHSRINHHLLPMTAEHLPYTHITSIPATDEPAPSTLVQSRLIGQFQWMRSQFGTRTHLTGDGGDSVLFQPPIHLADLIRHRRWRRATSEAFGWARLRHDAALPLLRDAVRAARTSRGQALAELAQTIGSTVRSEHGHVRWFPLLPFPAWAQQAARSLLGEVADRAAATPDALPGTDASVRTLVDEIREVARTAVADAEIADAYGIDLHNPFLDPVVMHTVLQTSLDERPPVYEYKPVLARAMADLLPPAVAARTTKGSFDADHYAGLRANLTHLLTLADGHLARMGLIDPARFRRSLHEAAAGIPMPLATIEQALSVEAWLTAHYRTPVLTWTTGQATSAHG